MTEEVPFARKLSAKHEWALLDVTRRSIEETAAAIMKLLADRQRQRLTSMTLWRAAQPLILASQSRSRQTLLPKPELLSRQFRPISTSGRFSRPPA